MHQSLPNGNRYKLKCIKTQRYNIIEIIKITTLLSTVLFSYLSPIPIPVLFRIA